LSDDLAAEKRRLRPEGQPGLTLSGKIASYELSSTVNTAIGGAAGLFRLRKFRAMLILGR
jgi:hypothetical protein